MYVDVTQAQVDFQADQSRARYFRRAEEDCAENDWMPVMMITVDRIGNIFTLQHPVLPVMRLRELLEVAIKVLEEPA